MKHKSRLFLELTEACCAGTGPFSGWAAQTRIVEWCRACCGRSWSLSWTWRGQSENQTLCRREGALWCCCSDRTESSSLGGPTRNWVALRVGCVRGSALPVPHTPIRTALYSRDFRSSPLLQVTWQFGCETDRFWSPLADRIALSAPPWGSCGLD